MAKKKTEEVQETSPTDAVAIVYSTASNDNFFPIYHKTPDGLPIQDGGVLIKGGSGVAHLTQVAIVTPRGVATRVNAEELEILERSDTFKQMQKAGYMVIDKTMTKQAAEDVVAGGMTAEDQSAPITPETAEARNIHSTELKG